MVDLWFANLRTPGFSSSNRIDWLDAEERSRYLLIKDCTKAKLFADAHVALRLLLGRHMGVRPADVRFHRNECGRPFVYDGPDFSLSHSGCGVLIAIASDGVVGADLEQRRIVDFQFVLHDICSHAELRRIRKPKYHDIDWLRFWVRKEAAVKALGVGLRSLCDVAVSLSEEPHGSRRVILKYNGRIRLWYLYDLDVGREFIASVVTDRSHAPTSMRLHHLSLGEFE